MGKRSLWKAIDDVIGGGANQMAKRSFWKAIDDVIGGGLYQKVEKASPIGFRYGQIFLVFFWLLSFRFSCNG